MLKTMNILVVSSKYEPEYAGSAIRAQNTYKRLSKRFSITYEILTSSVERNHCGTYQVDGHKVTRIAKKLFLLATDEVIKDKRHARAPLSEKLKHGCNYLVEAALTWKYLVLNINKFDLIHVFGKNWVTAAVVTFAKAAKKPMIIELCNEVSTPYHYEPFLFRLIFGQRFPENTEIVCISKALEEMCQGYGYRNNVWCRPNPVATDKFLIDRENKQLFRKKYSEFGANDILLLCLSKFRPSKNQIFLLEVIKRLPENFKLLLAGPVVGSGPLGTRDWEYLESIRRLIIESGLEPRVQLEAKFINNVDEYLKMSDVFLFPTTTEALGTPMLESISCGVPVVANRLPGVTDCWIKDGKNGYISGLNAEEFAEKIKKAVEIDSATLESEREELVLRCSAEVIDNEYHNLLWKVIKRGRRDKDTD